MTCRDVDEFLMRYLDGDLTAEQRVTFEQHVARCADCRRYVEGYRRAANLAAEACRESPDDPYADAPPELVVAILRATRGCDAAAASEHVKPKE